MDWANYIALGKGAVDIMKSITETVKTATEARSVGKPGSEQVIDSALETLRDKVAELQQKQLELQNTAFALAQENATMFETHRAALAELERLKAFDADRRKFQRVLLANNTFAYGEKNFEGRADDQPLLCPNCFEHGKKTYLSFKQFEYHTKQLECTACRTSVHVPRNERPDIGVAKVRRGWDVLDPYGDEG